MSEQHPFAPLPWQKRAFLLPELWDLLLAGARGGGKTVLLLLLILRHCVQYGDRARVLVLRRTYKSLEDLIQQLKNQLPVSKQDRLRRQMEEAISREDYEKAASIQDQLKKLPRRD